MKKTTRFWINILIILMVLIGSFGILRFSGKVIITSTNLIILRDNASFYNAQFQKTDEMTKAYNENNMKRQDLYTSEDTFVRVFSNLPTLLKLVGLLCAIATWWGIPYMWYMVIKARSNKVRRAEARKRKMKRQAYMTKGSRVQ